MKKKMRLFAAGISFILVISLLLPATIAVASPEKAKRPDKDTPVQAQSVNIVKKISEKPGPPTTPPGKDKPDKDNGAATGILGIPVSGERYAIIIGISDYPGLSYDLNYCDDDAIDIYTILTNIYGFAPENITLLIDGNATRSAILAAIENIPTTAGEVVFSFSGHGGNGEADDYDDEVVDEFIVAHNGIDLVPIWDGELQLAFSGISARAIFLFDSCNSGGLTDLSDENRVICMASSETGLSYEYSTLQNGQFTYYFAEEGVLQGYADSYDHDNDGDAAKKRNPGEPDDVVIEEAFDYANKKCRRQSPVISDFFENDLLP